MNHFILIKLTYFFQKNTLIIGIKGFAGRRAAKNRNSSFLAPKKLLFERSKVQQFFKSRVFGNTRRLIFAKDSFLQVQKFL